MPTGAVARRATIALVVFGALAACQTGPRLPLMSPLEEGGHYGYSERQLSENRYEVVYVGPSVRTWLDREKREVDVESARNLAYDLALWRAAELAKEHEFAAFTVEDRHSDVEVEIIDEGPWIPHYGFRHHRQFGFYGIHDYGLAYRSAWLQASATLTVVMQTEVSEDGFDAAATAQRLKKKRPEALEPR